MKIENESRSVIREAVFHAALTPELLGFQITILQAAQIADALAIQMEKNGFRMYKTRECKEKFE